MSIREKSTCSNMSTLVPIRIDVSSSSSLPSSTTTVVPAVTPAWRAVDTLLMDPTVPVDISAVAHQWCADQARSLQLDTTTSSIIAEAILSHVTVSTVARQITTQLHSHHAAIVSASAIALNSTTTTNSIPDGNLVPIVIRFEWQGLCICDEFNWDPSLSSGTTFNALCMAQTLAADLNLPEDAVNALAIDIAEQVCVAMTTATTSRTATTSTSSDSNITTTAATTAAAAGQVPVSLDQQTQDSTLLERDDDFVRAAVTAAATAQGTTDPTTATATNTTTAVVTNNNNNNNSSRTTAAWMVTPSSQATHVLHLASHYFPPRT
jgi:SNF5 / SMARCB1 / INI1